MVDVFRATEPQPAFRAPSPEEAPAGCVGTKSGAGPAGEVTAGPQAALCPPRREGRRRVHARPGFGLFRREASWASFVGEGDVGRCELSGVGPPRLCEPPRQPSRFATRGIGERPQGQSPGREPGAAASPEGRGKGLEVAVAVAMGRTVS